MFWKKIAGLLRQRCPVCLEGPVFKKGMDMHSRCPRCNILYEREVGYFIGSWYVMYGLATVIMALGMLAVHLLWPDMDLGNAVLIAVALFLPLTPVVVRYSRVVWMYFDRWAWPGGGGGLEVNDS